MTTAGRASKKGEERAGLALAPLALPLISMLTCVLVVVGHLITAERSQPLWGVLILLCGSALFLLPPLRAGHVDLENTKARDSLVGRNKPLVTARLWRIAFIVNCGILAALAFWAFGDNRIDRGFWFWVASLVYLAVGLGMKPSTGVRQWLEKRLRHVDGRTVLALLVVTAIAIFFRLYRLAEVPVEMTSDHAEKLLDVHDVLEGLRPIFFPRNTGREGFQFYLTAALIRWTPLQLNHLALKVGTAIFGILTVPATYFLGKELYGKRVGQLAAFFLAISLWHVTITRVGLRFPFTAAFGVPALYFLFKALRENGRNSWLAAGALLGIGLHTYTAMRIMPLLFLVLVAIRVVADVAPYGLALFRGQRIARIRFMTLRRAFWENALAGAAFALLVFLPLLRYMTDNPEGFWYRATSRAQEAMSLAEIWGTFWENVGNALLMFNYRGDVVPMNTVPESPVLGPITGGLFVLGVAYLLWQLLVHRKRTPANVFSGLLILLLPSILSLAYPGENPSVVRTGGAIPFVMIIAALPLAVLHERLAQAPERAQGLWGQLLLPAVLIVALLYNFNWYFNGYDENIRRSIWNATELGAALKTFEEEGGDLENAYHVAYPHWVDTRNIGINAGHITWNNAVTDVSDIAAHATRPGKKLYLVFPADEVAIEQLRKVYPQGVMRLHESERPGKQFLIFQAPGAGDS